VSAGRNPVTEALFQTNINIVSWLDLCTYNPTLEVCVTEEPTMYNDLLLDRLVAAPIDSSDDRIPELIQEIEELDNLLSPEAQQLIRDLRPHTVTDDVYEEIDELASIGDRLADWIAGFAGSWRFIIAFLSSWVSGWLPIFTWVLMLSTPPPLFC
jgi:hypothetical protein